MKAKPKSKKATAARGKGGALGATSLATTARAWLLKSEPEVYSIADLERDGTTTWEGVRNFQARNYLRDHMRVGDRVLFYHSNAQPSGVGGLATVSRVGLPDPLQFVKGHDLYDAAATVDEPRWFMVELAFAERFGAVVELATLKADARLNGMMVTQKGSRLSVQPVSDEHLRVVLGLAGAKHR